MDKKGITFLEGLGWFFGIFVVLLIASMFFGEESLLAKGRDKIFSFGSGLLPEDKTPEFPEEESRIPEEFEDYFDNLASKLKNFKKSKDSNNCWIQIGEMPSENAFSIDLYEDRLEINKQSERGLTPPEKTEIIEDFSPCSIKGEKANVFYNCLRQGTRCGNGFETGNIALSQDTKIAPLLFKFDSSHFCMVYIKDFWGGCKSKNGLIDEDCVGQIRIKYPTCT